MRFFTLYHKDTLPTMLRFCLNRHLFTNLGQTKGMGLIASLPEIDRKPSSVFVMHEKSEKLIPSHTHTKGQLSYVEGGLAYITVENRTFVVPARHFFWIPKGIRHTLRVGHFATVLRSLYFYTSDDNKDQFYGRLGIYPASELLINMIAYTERWDGRHIETSSPDFPWFIAIKRLLPQIDSQPLLISLPDCEDERLQKVIRYMQVRVSEPLTLTSVSQRFGMSERSMSRLFQAEVEMSFLQYLKTLRMIRAIELLLKTHKPVGVIAFDVGYSNIASFSNAFYKFTDYWPSDFRKK